jgi:hypothetical protein
MFANGLSVFSGALDRFATLFAAFTTDVTQTGLETFGTNTPSATPRHE